MLLPSPTKLSNVINQGLAKLRVEHDGEQSLVVEQYSQVPLQLHRPLYLDGVDYPTVYIKTPSSGLLGGDVHELDVQVAADSRLELRTQAATLVYPGESSLSINIKVARGGKLTYLPHVLILGKASSLSQKVRIELEPGASLEYADTWCAGRIAMNELWRFAKFDYCLEILKGGKLSYRERWVLTPESRALDHAVICGDYTHFSSLYAFGADAQKIDTVLIPLVPEEWKRTQVWTLERDEDVITKRCGKANF